MELREILGTNIVKHRTQQKLTQQSLATRSEISVAHLRNIEHGRGNTSLDVIERISSTLNVGADVLLKK